jgi:hypothetical protein
MITDSLFKAIPCDSQDQAIGRAYAFSKVNDGITYYVIACHDTGKVFVDTNNTIRYFERLVCTFYKGIKTVYP